MEWVKHLCALLVVLGNLKRSDASAGNAWTYRGQTGPDYWHLDYPHCGGIKQSPISILTEEVIVDSERLSPFEFSGYDDVRNVNMTLENNGHTVQVDLGTHGVDIEVSGGGLPGTFIATQFHFHWGSEDKRGSEHNINGHLFPMEMHIVHYNRLYPNISEAMSKEDGLVVLGFLFRVGRYNEHFEEIISHFRQIARRDSHTEIQTVPLASLLPNNLEEFYRYEGSLTTPPCYESVIWTIFNETIEIAEEQLEDFRTKIFEDDESSEVLTFDVSDDFRPTQCLHHRRVYASHTHLKYSKNYNVDGGNPNSAGRTTTNASFLLFAMTVLVAIRL